MVRKYGRRWQADVRANGQRLRPTFLNEGEAKLWEFQAKEAVRNGQALPPTPTNKIIEPLATLGGLFSYVANAEWEQARSGTKLVRNGQLACEYFGYNKDISTITEQDIVAYKLHLAHKGNSPATVNRKLAALSKMLHVAVRNQALTHLPHISKNKEQKTKFRYLDEYEEEALLGYWQGKGYEDIYHLCVLLLDTGARCFSEMLPLKWDAVAQDYQRVTFWHTKTNKPRTIPLTSRCRELLAIRHVESPREVFKDGRINKLRGAWDEMRKALSFPDVTLHTLRHTCCTRLVLGGVDIKRVMEWMGHSTILTTMRYMQLRPTGLDDALDVLERAEI